jgi:oligoribonuclease NrnB/cAMP/cGMP phosphodiesterase (DHH superfamily)
MDVPIDDYLRKTPDAVMLGVLCEFKSPTGDSKKTTTREQFERAVKQGATWLVFDSRRTRLADDFLKKEIQKELSHRKRIKKVVFIDKHNNVVEFSK